MIKFVLLLFNWFGLTLQLESCGWLVETVSFKSLVPAQQHYSKVLQDQLIIKTSSSYMLRYMLKITAGCNGKKSDNLMRSLILQGVTPNIHLVIKSNQIGQSLIYEYEMRGLLVPVKNPDLCDEANCPNMWLIPFPIYNTSTRARIIISSDGIGYHDFYSDIEFDVAYLFPRHVETNLKVVLFKKAIKKFMDLSPLYVDVNPDSNFAITISLLPMQPLMLQATSDFSKYFFIELIPNETNFSQVCLNPHIKIHSVMVLPGVTLLGTKFGLLAQKNNSFHRVSPMCVNQITTKADDKTQVVLITSNHLSAKDKCGSVSVAYISSKTTSWPSFIEVKDQWSSNVHRYCQVALSADCCLVSSALSQKAWRFYFLVLNELKDIYYILEYNRIHKTWSKLCSLNATVYLSKIYVHDRITAPAVFAYGSDIFICQPTNQMLVYLTNTSDQEVVQLITLHDDYFMFLRKGKQIGIGQVGETSISYLSDLWSRSPNDLYNLVALYKLPSGTPLLIQLFTNSNNETDLKLIRLNYEKYIAQFNYNKQLKQGLKNEECTIEKLGFSFPNLTKLTGVKSFHIASSENNDDSPLNNKQSIYLYQGIASFITNKSVNPDSKKSGYHSLYRDAISEWQHSQDSIIFNSLEDLKEKIKRRPSFELRAKNYKQVFEPESNSSYSFPSTIYLDSRDVFIMQVSIHFSSNHNYLKDPIRIIQSSSELEAQYFQIDKIDQISTYEIHIKGSEDVYNENPDGSLVSSLIELQFPDDNGKTCIHGSTEPRGKYKINTLLGCPPSKHLLFDSYKTISLNKYHFESNYDCLHPIRNKPCFNFYGGFNPVFTLVDDVSGVEMIYTDPLIFLVVGGGAVFEGIRLFSQREITDYNFLNGSEHHAIWRPDHHELHSDDHDPYFELRQEANFKRRLRKLARNRAEVSIDDAVPIIKYGGKAIQWLCEWHSPCGNVDPKFPDDAQYDLLIEVTNKGLVTNFTSCDLTFRFIIRIHGLPASLIHKALPQLGIAAAFIFVMFTFYHCLRIYRKKLNSVHGD